MKSKPSIQIDEWAVSRRKDRSLPGEKTVAVLTGIAPLHPKFKILTEEEKRDQPILNSSRLVYFNFEKRVAESCNTVYELGSIDEFWAHCLEEEGILLSSFDFDGRVA